ncbi:winged helix DNA-binding domain-containing protein [Solirubrobacter ginsenosidimutans]|uniref:Winged helix DNA-binding domain-containing protein n=1 Tax=Solirubrobacter ginsenosidimutans TaxID=490573 RepID=A0A9X3S1H5_9ACTN|nr:crosslink repair DNA glycosylase YcaQ family protein [Solirubrobacter ginsenosidimutans]MDA0162359.1 winged helix DNA-binding domain-containing protein [Solirubrobacter ginsenosidimutans]
MHKVDPAAIRRLAIRNQRLDGPAPRKQATADDLLETVKALRCLQLDPTAIVARNHLLVLFSRHGAFDEATFEQIAYQRRDLFEYWAHEASYVLSDDLPIHRYAMKAPEGGAWRAKQNRWWDTEADFRTHIVERLEQEGPLRARDIEDRAQVGWESTGWTHARNVARMLDLMWVRGHVGISRREGAQRVWDLMARCLAPAAPREELSDEEVTYRAAPYAIKALGAGRIPHIRAHFTRNRYPHLARVLARLESEGTLTRIEVDGLGDDWWIHSEDLETLESADFKPRTALLSPFDNLLCDRARTEALFGFTHRLEIYVPKPKRRWGYFVLPVLDGDRLVARIDLAMDRKRGVLQAIEVHKEPRTPRGKRLPQAIRRELERLAAWRGATGIEVVKAPPEWLATLAA